MKLASSDLADLADFLLIYIEEAHPSEKKHCEENIVVKEHKALKDRINAAEMLVEVGLNVKQASPFEHTYVAAYSNGYIHYGPPASAYPKGGYEVTECLLAPEWQALYEAKVAEVLRRLE